MDAHAHFLQLARYNVWATRRLTDAVASVAEADDRKDLAQPCPEIDLVYLLQEENEA
ncbi:MAG: hypothetical protein R3E94_08265 [Burkholderiaceae bacterium]